MIFSIGLMSILWIVAILLTIYGTWLTIKHWRSSAQFVKSNLEELPGITILKPLKGVDPSLESNLRSFFYLDYPKYEIIFSVAEPSDPSVQIVKKLIQQHSDVQAQLVIGEVEVGYNPKVNNMIKSYHRARFDHILISDSNITVDKDYLLKKVAHMDPSVGVVTAVVLGCNPQGIGGHLESVLLNSFFSRGMLLAASADKTAVLGKSMLFKKSELKRIGGLETLGEYLAEDYMAGVAMKHIGKKSVLMSGGVKQVIGEHQIKNFWARHLRWGKIRKVHAPLVYPFEILFSPFLIAIFGGVSLEFLFSISFWNGWMSTLLVFLVLDLLIQNQRFRKLELVEYCLVWFLLQPLVFFLRLQVLVDNKVSWRGKVLKLSLGGSVVLENEQYQEI